MKHEYRWPALGAWLLLVAVSCTTDTDDKSDNTTGGLVAQTNPESNDTGSDSPEEAEPFALESGVNTITWEEDLSIGTTTRHMVIHTPASYPDHGPLPVVFAFHGNAADAPDGAEPEKQWLDALGPMVDQEKFIGVYLRGIEGEWQLGPEGGDITTEEVIATLAHLQNRMAASPGVDSETTYCFGSSNGAALCQYTAANIGMFTGIGAEVSTLDAGDHPEPALPKISVVQMMNIKDMTVPYEGGESRVGHTYMSAEDGAAAWAAHNGCDPDPLEEEVAEPYKRTLTYSGCENDTVVVHVGAMPIPWDESCEGGAPPDPDLCGSNHSVSDDHFELPGGPWRYAYDLLANTPS